MKNEDVTNLIIKRLGGCVSNETVEHIKNTGRLFSDTSDEIVRPSESTSKAAREFARLFNIFDDPVEAPKSVSEPVEAPESVSKHSDEELDW